MKVNATLPLLVLAGLFAASGSMVFAQTSGQTVTPGPRLDAGKVIEQSGATTSGATAPSTPPVQGVTDSLDSLKLMENGGDNDLIKGEFYATPPGVSPNPLLQALPTLHTKAEVANLKAQASLHPVYPLRHHREGDLVFVDVKIKNDGGFVAVVDGLHCKADFGTTPLITAETRRNLARMDSKFLNCKGYVLTSLTTGLTLGLAGPITYEILTPDIHRKKSLGVEARYDGVRIGLEDKIFGRRLLMPGDETAGWLSFQVTPGQSVKSIQIPIIFPPTLQPAGSLVVSVASTAKN